MPGAYVEEGLGHPTLPDQLLQVGAHVPGRGGAEVVGQIPGIDRGNDLIDGTCTLRQGRQHLLLPLVAVAGIPGDASRAVVNDLAVAGAEDSRVEAGQGFQGLHVLPEVTDAGGGVAENGVAAEHRSVGG